MAAGCWRPPGWERSTVKKSEQEHLRHISAIKRVTRKFMEVSRCNRAKQRQIKEMYRKRVLHYCCFFRRSRSLQRLALHVRLYIYFV